MESISGRFRVDLVSVWGRFGVGLASIWDRVEIDLGPVWDQFGIDLGSGSIWQFRGKFGLFAEVLSGKVLSGKVPHVWAMMKLFIRKIDT